MCDVVYVPSSRSNPNCHQQAALPKQTCICCISCEVFAVGRGRKRTRTMPPPSKGSTGTRGALRYPGQPKSPRGGDHTLWRPHQQSMTFSLSWALQGVGHTEAAAPLYENKTAVSEQSCDAPKPEKFQELVPLGVCANGRTLNHEIALPSNLTERLQQIENKVILADLSHRLRTSVSRQSRQSRDSSL